MRARAAGIDLSDDVRRLVIGGDHSCAVGTWSGVAAAHRTRGTLGLVHVVAIPAIGVLMALYIYQSSLAAV